MKELVVISGKGGTGKTSVVASFAALADNAVLADCDVDAADLHLVLDPRIIRREDFSGGSRASIDPELCMACGLCQSTCRFEAIEFDGPENDAVARTYRVDPIACEGCGVCAWICPQGAINFAPAVNGEWYLSDTRYGPMVHARLGVAEENSGKLVSLVREQARAAARRQGRDLILIDGSPGIGCPVIASITGADQVLIVTEPTLSGLHDLERVADVAEHFAIPAMVCVNRWDINPELTRVIERRAANRGLIAAGRVRYDRAVTDAQFHRLSVVEYNDLGGATDMRALWERVGQQLEEHGCTT